MTLRDGQDFSWQSWGTPGREYSLSKGSAEGENGSRRGEVGLERRASEAPPAGAWSCWSLSRGGCGEGAEAGRPIRFLLYIKNLFD